MPTFTPNYLLDVCTRLFAAHRAPEDEARIAAEELVESSLLGFDSHGVMRASQYAQDIREGRIRPGSPITIAKQTPTTAIVDCGFNFGAVSARRMVEVACEKAQGGIACVVSHNSHHVGRLGAWVQRIAERDLIGLAFVNNTRGGHSVAPWGGREGRLGTNPLAWAVPVAADSTPIVMDMATCMMPEGKIRVHLHAGKPLPPGIIVDAHGRPSTDPKVFYGPPRGAILPFGGQYGYKGFGLALLVELLGGVLAGYTPSQPQPHVNGLCLIAINPEAFCGAQTFKALVEDLRAYVVNTPTMAGFDEVIMPGAIDFRIRERRMHEGIPLADESWRLIVEAAAQVGLMV
ncbi:MAG: dehydrogenase [Candidatus Roseilinea sp.]|nr:MAG: dehydrogenase [Candidatus Roseilinea sp.]